jgi:conjugative relaxase-like TrwC/TraI family protein
MLDITTINSNIKDGARYYTKEESYYSEDEEVQEMTESEWFGNMAPDQPYSADLFTKMFYGNLPSGQRMRGEVMGKGKERLAYDLTFKVPGKSLSLQIHGPNGDKRLWEAHVEAIKEVLAIVESEYAGARVQTNGDRQAIKTGNIAATLVHHHESRAGDPHVHTHVVLFNGTLCPDGEYRALWYEPLRNSGVLGDLYHQKLALKVQALGYEITETKTGFELAGVTDKQIEAFSKRSTEIDDYLKAKGWSNTPENRQKAVFETRIAKDNSESLEQKRDRWSNQMQAVGFTGITPADHPIIPTNTETPRELLDAAIAHLSERQSSFSREDIQRFVFSHLRSFDEKPLNEEINKHPDLLTAWDGRYTTQSAVDRDLRIIENWLKGNDSVQPLNPSADFSSTKLSSGQAEAMRRLLSSPDQFQILKGLAGTGKTTAMAIAREQLPAETVIKVFAATHNAKNAIADQFQMEGATIAELACSQPTNEPNQLWILDEAGMIGSADFATVMDKADKVGARVWAVGDTGQNPAISAGAPQRMLMHNGATVHKLSEIIRQQNKEQKRAVELIAEGHGVEALNILEKQGNIHQLEDAQTKTSAAVDLYISLPQSRRDKTIIVIGTNAERQEFTEQLRGRLIQEGRLTKDTQFTQLKNRNLTEVQKNRAENYNKGDLLILHRKHRNYTQLQTHVPYKVLKVEGQLLHVQSPGGRQFKINPAKHERKEVYTARKNQIAVGDRLRFTSTNKKAGIYTNTYLSCADIQDGIATVQDSKGQQYELDLSKPQKIDHDWTTTSYRAQGGTNSETIFVASLNPTSAMESFYVAISRHRTSHIAVFTESVEKLKEWLGTSNAQQNAIETLFDPFEGWTPDYTGVEKPWQIDEDTWKDMQGSGIHPSLLTPEHVRTVYGNDILEPLLEEDFLKHGAGQELTAKMRRILEGTRKVEGQWTTIPETGYNHLAYGGGWIGYGGTDLLSVINGNPQPSLYCQVKGKTPRSINGEEVKYETPKGVDQQVFLPHIPDEIAERIYRRNAITPTQDDREKGVWYVADKYNLPIVLTEGLKKTWSSLSQGHLTVGLPGVNALYRAKDEFGNRLPQRELTEYGKALAKPGRQITFAFDQDTKLRAIFNVRRDLVRTVELLQAEGVVCKLAPWEAKLGKGLDDVITNVGPRAYNVAIAHAISPEAEVKRHYRGQYNSICKRVVARLGDVPKERLDLEVYSHCLNNAELNDAYRFISESDHMRAATPDEKRRYLLAIHDNARRYQQFAHSGRPEMLNETVVKMVNHSIGLKLVEEEEHKKALLRPEQRLDDIPKQEQSYSVGF